MVLRIVISMMLLSSLPSISGQTTYTLGQLSQEPVRVAAEILPISSQESGDTSFTLFKGTSVSFKTYFVNGADYDNIFNPHPTGIVINGKPFKYFCDLERAYSQNYNDFLTGKEITFLGKRYIVLINFREDCLASGCHYRCYNIFDISNPQDIRQIAFSSVFDGLETLGEFNNDGIIDFVRVAPKSPANSATTENIPYFLVTCYSLIDDKVRQLTNNKGETYYMYTKSDPFEFSDFNILRCDWFVPLKDTTNTLLETTPYFAPYISFDPKYKHLYTPDGIRVEKHNWSVLVKQLGNLEAAKNYCNLVETKSSKKEDVYIMVDQYSGNISFQILSGNFVNKNLALQHQKVLSKNAISGKLLDLKSGY